MSVSTVASSKSCMFRTVCNGGSFSKHEENKQKRIDLGVKTCIVVLHWAHVTIGKWIHLEGDIVV